MERIGRGDLVGNRLGTAVRRLRLGGFFQLAAEGVGDVADLRLVGERLEETLAQDVVDLVGREVDRRDVAFLAAEFGARVFESAIDESCRRCRMPPRDPKRPRRRFFFLPAAVSRLAKARVAMSATVPLPTFCVSR